MKKTIAAVALTAVAVGGGTATAAKFITSANIKDGTIQTEDIGRDEVTLNRLSPGVRAMLSEAGKPGKDGVNGASGAKGTDGVKGNDGANGTSGGKGNDGAKGDKGDRGQTGADGADAAHTIKSLVPYVAGQPEAVAPAWGSVRGASIDANGIKFGAFANGTDFEGAYSYGLKNVRLRDLALLAYSTKYTGGTGTGAAPYIIIVTAAGDHVTFSPNTQSGVTPQEDTWQRWVVTQGTVRYNEDSVGTELSWANLVAAHGGEKIDYVQVQAGNAGASDGSTSHVRTLTMEATGAEATFANYIFGS